MLEGMRKAQQNWLGKIIISILFGFLILSFGIWGISDVFRGRQSNTVITAGKTQVPFDALQSAYAMLQRNIEQRIGKPLSPKEAQAMQLDQQALSQLVAQAVLDETARKLGLAASDEQVGQFILSMPAFQSAIGFDRNALDSFLRNIGMTEAGFIAEQRASILRQQIGDSLVAGISTPQPLKEVAFRLANEKRDVSFFTLTEADAGTIPSPTNEQLEAVYQAQKAQFRAPEYRSFDALVINPEQLIKSETISEGDLRKAYETLKATRYTSDERRSVDQIVFSNEGPAKSALARLKSGSITFENLAKELKITPEALSIGNLTKAEMLDPKIAEAAFSLQKDTISDVVDGMLGPTLIRVTKIGTAGFEDVKEEIRTKLARERALRAVSALRDEIDDMTANARPFAEIAKEKNLQLMQVKAIDKNGLDLAGQPVTGLPDLDVLTQAVFASDIGIDNASISAKDGGYIWFNVTNVIPSRDRTLNEVRSQIIDIWKKEEVANRLLKIASEKIEQIKSIEDLKKAASSLKLNVKSADQVSRNSEALQGFGAEGSARLFSTPVGQAATIVNDKSVVVFLVTSAKVPVFNADGTEAKALNEQLAKSIGGDIISQFAGNAQKQLGVTVDQNVARRLFGAASDY